MMTTADYHRIIKKIEDSCGAGRGDSDSFWMEQEHLFNSFAKTNFLSQRNSEDISLALDNDKHHFNHSKNSDTHGLKKCRHIKDNRFGHTCHTCGLSASGLPLCARFEREDETQTQVFKRITRILFGSRTGNGNPNLQGTCISSSLLLL